MMNPPLPLFQWGWELLRGMGQVGWLVIFSFSQHFHGIKDRVLLQLHRPLKSTRTQVVLTCFPPALQVHGSPWWLLPTFLPSPPI